MAYCNECGAYIPDGHSKCLACGFDKTEAAKAAEEAKQSSQAYEYKYEEPRRVDNDFLREQLEQQRKRQQENSRKWAETEKAQRERSRQNNQRYSTSTRSTDAKKYSAPTNVSTSKIFAAISYLGILFAVPYLLCKEDDFAMFHAKQGMILFLVCLIGKIAGSILGLGWLVNIARLYFIYKGVSSVLNGRKDKLPYIGSLL